MLPPYLSAFMSGLAMGASLIIAIGAQNAFVLRQGLRRSHVVVVVSLCVLCDWVLIVCGALGFGSLVQAFPAVTSLAAWGGALFLLGYGAIAFRAAAHPGVLIAEKDSTLAEPATVSAVALSTLAVSLLNPHVYLDTVVLLGSVAGQYAGVARAWFTVGACLASLVWFCTLGFGARLLGPLFARPASWRVLDAVVGGVMWWIAVALIVGQLR